MHLPQPIPIGPSLKKGDSLPWRKRKYKTTKKVVIVHYIGHQKGGSLEAQENRQHIWLPRRQSENYQAL